MKSHFKANYSVWITSFLFILAGSNQIHAQEKFYKNEFGHFGGGIAWKVSGFKNTEINNYVKADQFVGQIFTGAQHSTGMDLELIGGLVLSFYYKTLLGECLEDYQLIWWLNDHYSVPNYSETLYRRDLENYPDLLDRYDHLKPLDIEFALTLNYQLCEGIKYAIPDIISRSGIKGDLSVPEVREWDHFFDETTKVDVIHEMANRAKMISDQNKQNGILTAIYNSKKPPYKLVHDKSEWVSITSIEIKSIAYPIQQMKSLYEDYLKRKSGEDLLPSEEIAKAIAASKSLKRTNSRPLKKEEMSDQSKFDPCNGN